MAYISGAEILQDIPLDPEEVPIDQTEADQIVEKWIGLVTESGATDESFRSRDIVATGATAEIGKKALRRSGLVETGEFDDDLQRAYRMLRDFDLAVLGGDTDIGGGDVIVQVDEFDEYADDVY